MVLDKEQVPKAELDKLFGDGAILSDNWYELKIEVKALSDNGGDDYFEMCFPAGYAFATMSDWKAAADWLDEVLNKAITDGYGDNFHVMLKRKAFSGMSYQSNGGNAPVQMPFVLPKKYIDEDFEEVINSMWNFLPELAYDKLKELSDDESIVKWDKDYKPNTFEI